MRIAACIVLSLLAGLVGLIGGAMVGGLGICALSVDIPLCIGLLVAGWLAVIFGCSCGKKIGWIPGASYCLPIAVLGGMFPIMIREWDRVIASWVVIGLLVLSYVAVEAVARGKMRLA